MDEALRVLLAVLVALALAAIGVYVVGFLVLAVWTASRRDRPDLVAKELDRALGEILSDHGPTAIARSPAPTRRVPTWHR